MNLEQNTQEWLEIRKHKIGASDAPVIMGVSPWTTPLQLWEEKMNLKEVRQSNYAMDRGREMERAAREHFEKLTGIMVFPQVIYHPEYDWMMASLDGINLEGTVIVEIKCPGREDHHSAVKGKIPEKYFPQLQHQLEVSGLDKGYYFSFDGKDGVIIEFKKDEEYVASLLEKEREFWACMQNFIPPDASDRDYVDKNDELWMTASAAWVKCNAQLRDLKAKEEELRETLIYLSGNHNAIGGGIKLQRIIQRGNINYKNIPELMDIDLEPYRGRPVFKWRLTEK